MIFITINLYNFILCILNNFLKTYLKIITEGFTDRIYLSAFDSSCYGHRWIYGRIYSIDIMDSPTIFPTALIRRYFTVPATMTDEYTDGYLRSVFQTFTEGCNPLVCHTITDGIFQEGNVFFCAQFSSVKPSANVFFADWYSDGIWYYQRKESRRTYSVGVDVRK